MKKIAIVIVFSLLCLNLWAEDNQEKVRRNIFILDVGKAFSNAKMAIRVPNADKYSSFHDVDKFDTTGNVSFSYLRRLKALDNKLSLGGEIFILAGVGDRVYYEEYKAIMGNDAYQPIHYDDQGRDYTAKEWKYNSGLGASFLVNYEILKTKSFDLSTTLGIGGLAHSMSINYTGYRECILFICHYTRDSKSYGDTTVLAKIGLLGYYNITRWLAFGLNSYYIYTEPAKFHFKDNDVSYKVKNNGIITTNVSLRMQF
ncbi:MAG: hypothetical protein LBH40_04655 [Alphaproteobacteria bacterium]|jgi:hypothetical protein|nr:hypothetical protein [Alphaproteobacteria bacterium]